MAELNDLATLTTFSPGPPMMPECVLATGTGLTQGTTAENVAWTWSASKLRRNTNGSSRESLVSYIPTYYRLLDFLYYLLPLLMNID